MTYPHGLQEETNLPCRNEGPYNIDFIIRCVNIQDIQYAIVKGDECFTSSKSIYQGSDQVYTYQKYSC